MSVTGPPLPGRYLYRVCGLLLESPLTLPLPRAAVTLAPPQSEAAAPEAAAAAPEAAAAAPGADVRLVRGPVPEVPPGADPQPAFTAGGEVVLAWEGLGAFRVGRRRVVFDPLPGASPEALAAQLLGPVLAVLLHLRGVLPLHASAVATAAGAAVFLGFSGAGKSTVAAALVARGARLLADDVTAVAAAPPRVLPSAPELRLWPDAAEALGWQAAEVPEPVGGPGAAEAGGARAGGATADAAGASAAGAIAGTSAEAGTAGKRAYAVAAPEAAGRAGAGLSGVPLVGVWVLDAGSRVGMEALSPRAAAAELLRHGWTSRLVGAKGVPAAEAAAHLERSAAVAAAVPVSRLTVGPLAALPELVALLAPVLALPS